MPKEISSVSFFVTISLGGVVYYTMKGKGCRQACFKWLNPIATAAN